MIGLVVYTLIGMSIDLFLVHQGDPISADLVVSSAVRSFFIGISVFIFGGLLVHIASWKFGILAKNLNQFTPEQVYWRKSTNQHVICWTRADNGNLQSAFVEPRGQVARSPHHRRPLVCQTDRIYPRWPWLKYWFLPSDDVRTSYQVYIPTDYQIEKI